MYPEKAWQVIAYPMIPTFAGFAVIKAFDGDPAAWVFFVTCCLIAVSYLPYLIANEMGWLAEIDSPRQIVGYTLPKNYPLADGNAYAQDVEQISMDDEKYVAHTLINMQHSAKVDLTEGYWIVGKRFGGSREQFALMLRDWEQAGAIQRKSRAKNSPYVVADWNKIRKIVRGK